MADCKIQVLPIQDNIQIEQAMISSIYSSLSNLQEKLRNIFKDPNFNLDDKINVFKPSEVGSLLNRSILDNVERLCDINEWINQITDEVNL